jgi:hypothetical protein
MQQKSESASLYTRERRAKMEKTVFLFAFVLIISATLIFGEEDKQLVKDVFERSVI